MFPLVPFQGLRTPTRRPVVVLREGRRHTQVKALSSGSSGTTRCCSASGTCFEFGRADRGYQLITGADKAATIVAIAVGAIVVANAMLLSLVERYREFGVLRAIGWSRRRLIALIFGEA